MTSRKDFKRVVRARAGRTGESYSSALRNVRNAHHDRSAATDRGNPEREPLMSITRTIPDVRSTNVEKTVRFYVDLLGFDTRTEDGRVVSFVSASDEGVEVTLNRDVALPPGFTVEVKTRDEVADLFDRSSSAGVRVVESLRDRQFSVLDPAGRRVTVAAAPDQERPRAARDTQRPITRAIPGSVLDAESAKQFYGAYLGFQVTGEWSNPDAVMFESPIAPRAQLLTGSNLTSPSSFDLDVGTTARLDEVHAAAVGNAVVMGGPEDFPNHGVRCFLLLDPNGIAINVLAPLASGRA